MTKSINNPHVVKIHSATAYGMRPSGTPGRGAGSVWFVCHRLGSKGVEGGWEVKGIPSGFWHPEWLTRDLSVRQRPTP